MTSSPPFVLVHGSGHGSWCWERLLPRLTPGSIAVDLPGRGARSDVQPPVGLDDFAAAVVEDVDAAGLDDVVLVGHSMAGLTLPLVIDRLGSRVRRVVYVAAVVLLPDEDGVAAAGGLLNVLGRPFTRIGGPRRSAPRWLARRMFCNDLPVDEHAVVLDRLCSEWASIVLERPEITVQDSLGTPATYVKLLRDKTLPPRRQDVMAARLGPDCRFVTIDAGHEVMISRPDRLAEVLLGDVVTEQAS